MTKLLNFDFEIQYRTILENKAEIFFPGGTYSKFFGIIQPLSVADGWGQIGSNKGRKIIASIQAWKEKIGYSMVEGVLLYNGKLAPPKSFPLIEMMLQEYHNTGVGGHLGFLKTYKWNAWDVHWRGIKKDVKAFVDSCNVCQQNKYMSLSLQGLLQPLPISVQVWANISLNFIEGLPGLKVGTLFW